MIGATVFPRIYLSFFKDVVMRAIVVAVIVVSLFGGCASTAIEQYTLNQSLSVTDMRYQQVLNDLAEVAHNAGTLPGFAL
jgi:hypothetical protein